MDKKRDLVMGKLYFKNKDYRMAERSLNEYLTMNPEDAEALKLLAQVYEQIRRYDRAFEIYERCYLAEPSRTGVLLDICRILLMNEVWLEHVDYRKWLNLAISNFPSSPIVIDFRAFLATIPQTDQSNPQLEVQPSISMSRSSGGDDLSKILEKLTLMEKRMANIEDKLNNLSAPTESKSPNSLTTQKPTSTAVPQNSASPTISQKPTSPSAQKPSSPIVSQNSTSPAISQKPTTPIVSQKPSSPSSTPKLTPLNATQNLTPSTLFSNLTSPAPFSFNTNLFASSIQKLNLPSSNAPPVTPAQPTTTNLFAASMGKLNISTGETTPPQNLFAASIKKFNIPTGESAWGIKPQKPGNEVVENEGLTTGESAWGIKPQESGEEVVENEELPIENFCEMQPIEIKSGEEDENLLFEQRSKLYRLKDKEYKERGLGAIKVLKHKETGKGRLIMRREAIGLVCLNCWDCSKIERVRDTQVRWIGIDASDGEPEATVFLVKFKTKDMTDEFMSHLTALFTDEASSRNTSVSSPQPKSDDTKVNGNEKPEIELVDPQLDQSLVDKARELKLPDLFYHTLRNQRPCSGCDGCEEDE